jgi:hypothetical protein
MEAGATAAKVLVCFFCIKNPAKDFCYGDLNVRRRRRCCRRPSGKWLIGPRRTSNRATSFFISLVDTGFCY